MSESERKRLSQLSRRALRLEEQAKDGFRAQVKALLQPLPRPLTECREVVVTVTQNDRERDRLPDHWCRGIVRHWARMECMVNPSRVRLILSEEDRIAEPDNLLLRVVVHVVPNTDTLVEFSQE